MLALAGLGCDEEFDEGCATGANHDFTLCFILTVTGPR
jgi:hypothetical protein